MQFFKLSPEAKEIRRQLEDIPVLRRFRTSPLPDIVPLVFVLYAMCEDVDLRFEDGILLKPDKNDLRKDGMLERLYRMTAAQMLNGKCREAEELNLEIAPLKGEAYREAIPAFLYSYIRGALGMDRQYLYPEFLQQVFRRILRDHGASSIYEYGSGLGLIPQSYKDWQRYDAYEPGRVNILFAEMLQAITGGKEVVYTSRDYLSMPEQMHRYDTIVMKLIDPSTLDLDSYQHEIKMMDRLLALESWQQAVVVVNYGFCVGVEYEDVRKSICEHHLLEEVVEGGYGFHVGKYRSAILVLSRQAPDRTQVSFSQRGGRRTTLRFYDNISVSYEQLAGCHFVFESLLYRQKERESDESPSDGHVTTVTFGSLVKEFIHPSHGQKTESSGPLPSILEEDCEDRSSRVLLPKAPVRRELTPFLNGRLLFQSGSCICILLLDGINTSYKVCRIESKTDYRIPRETLSIVPADSVDSSYFVTWLLSFDGARYPLMAMASIVRAYSFSFRMPPEYLDDILSSRLVRVVLDKKRQAEIVKEFTRGELAVSETDARYGIALAGSPLSDEEKASLPGWGIDVVYETDRVAGPGGLEDILEADSEKPLRQVDAVFFDVNVDSEGAAVRYDGLFRAMEDTGKDIPLVVISDIELDSFSPAEKYMFNRLKEDNHIFVFKKDENAVVNAVRELRDRLDSRKSPERAVKMKYSEELGLAESIDPSGGMAVNLVKAMRGEFEDAEDPKEVSERFGLLRQGAETVFNRAKERGILPPLTFLGAMQQFLAGGEYFDNGAMRFYRLTEDVMPETLSCALGYFVTIVNAGSHAGQEGKLDVVGYISRIARSTNIYRSCAFILMDLLKWYGNLNADGPLYEETAPFRDDDLVRKARNGNQDYWYIGSFHLKYIPGLAEGIPGKDIRFKRVSLEKYPAPFGVENEIRYFLTEYRIDR